MLMLEMRSCACLTLIMHGDPNGLTRTSWGNSELGHRTCTSTSLTNFLKDRLSVLDQVCLLAFLVRVCQTLQ